MELKCESNNAEHRTAEASLERLVVRRGQAFTLTLELSQAFNQALHPLTITAQTGRLQDRASQILFPNVKFIPDPDEAEFQQTEPNLPDAGFLLL